MLSSEYYINNDHSKNPLKIFALAPVPYKRGLASGMAKVTEKLFSELGHMHDVKVERVTLPYISRFLAGLSTLHSLKNGLSRWKADAALTKYVFKGKSYNPVEKLKKYEDDYDLVFLLYTIFSPWLHIKKKKPTCAHVDFCTQDPRHVKSWRRIATKLWF